MDFGIIGKVLKHSFSAEIHPKLFDCKYNLWELNEDELDEFFSKREFAGINVTIPYKTDVIKYLDYIDPGAEKIGAVNTIVNKDGKLYGYNTDFSGLKTLIESNGVSLKGKNVLILGSGGTSKTAKEVCESMGASQVIRLSRRETEGFDTYDNIEKYYDSTDVIINTTPCGMYPNIYNSAIKIDGFSRLEAVFDAVYNPIRTKLICDAKKMGIKAEGGTLMLVFQAIYAARYFSGLDIPDSKGYEIFENMIRKKQNIVLIGMPSCGKSTVGKIIAKKLDKKFIDADKEIQKRYGKSPREIIIEQGEEAFRRYESETIADISLNQGMIIATGGGAVLKPENMEYLAENGKIVFIDRDITNLEIGGNRPLSSSAEGLKKLAEKRMPLYRKYAELTLKALPTPEKTADALLEMIK